MVLSIALISAAATHASNLRKATIIAMVMIAMLLATIAIITMTT